MSTSIKVLVVDDSSTFGRNIERWLNRTPGFKCVGVCATGEAAFEAVPEKKPDVVLMDIQMPGINGVQCTVELKRRMPALQIIVLTVYEDTETIFKALRAGASGYLLKRSSPKEILDAIRDIRSGGSPITSAIARKIVQAFQEPPPPQEPSAELTEREKEILNHLAKGFSNKEIADKLAISYFTVKAHLAHIFEKLHVRSRTEAVMAYLKQNPNTAVPSMTPPETPRN